MGRKAKFEKLEKNEAYYDLHSEEKEPEKEKKSAVSSLVGAVKEKGKKFAQDISKVPQKKSPSTKFTYTKNTRKVTYEDAPERQALEAPSKAPFILMLCVFCVMFACKYTYALPIFAKLSERNVAIAEIIMSVASYIVPSLVYIIYAKDRKACHNFKSFSPTMLPLMLSMLGLVICITALQKYYIAYTFSYSVEVGVSARDTLLVVITGAVLPAVCEEFFVHGVFQKEVSRYGGGFCGILVSGLVFALLHYEVQYFFIYLTAGVIMGALTHVTGSVIPAMIVHFLNNAISILFSDRLSFIATERIGGTLLMVVLAALSFILLIVVLRMVENITERKSEEKLFEKDTIIFVSREGRTLSRFGKVLSCPLMLVSYVLFFLFVIFF